MQQDVIEFTETVARGARHDHVHLQPGERFVEDMDYAGCFQSMWDGVDRKTRHHAIERDTKLGNQVLQRAVTRGKVKVTISIDYSLIREHRTMGDEMTLSSHTFYKSLHIGTELDSRYSREPPQNEERGHK